MGVMEIILISYKVQVRYCILNYRQKYFSIGLFVPITHICIRKWSGKCIWNSFNSIWNGSFLIICLIAFHWNEIWSPIKIERKSNLISNGFHLNALAIEKSTESICMLTSSFVYFKNAIIQWNVCKQIPIFDTVNLTSMSTLLSCHKNRHLSYRYHIFCNIGHIESAFISLIYSKDDGARWLWLYSVYFLEI